MVVPPSPMESQASQLGISPEEAGLSGSEAQPSPAQQQSETNLAAAVAGSSENFELLQERYGRDNPFAPLYAIQPKTPPPPELDANLPELSPIVPKIVYNPPDFHVTAIGIKDGQGIAVINGEILHVGDTIQDFTVMSITQDQVQLKDGMGDKLYLKLKQELRGDYNANKKEISNIGIKKQQSAPKPPAVKYRDNSQNFAPGPLPPLPDYSIPGPDDFKFDNIPPSGSYP